MPLLKKKDVFSAVFRLMRYPVITIDQLNSISDNKREFTMILSAKGGSDAICDLLFESTLLGKRD